MLEKHIEAKICDYAKQRGLLVYKFISPARAAVPDRLFILPGGRMFFCEFKREGQKPTPPQEREHFRLRKHGVSVWVIDNVDDGLSMIDEMLEPPC
ncbi:MAG: VRR-NUC domain-containing protein [Caulobacteraceae bacterium]|nr:VRR-NUC domain-containing protein [Caulobacteraceae bacterium]